MRYGVSELAVPLLLSDFACNIVSQRRLYVESIPFIWLQQLTWNVLLCVFNRFRKSFDLVDSFAVPVKTKSRNDYFRGSIAKLYCH